MALINYVLVSLEAGTAQDRREGVERPSGERALSLIVLHVPLPSRARTPLWP